MDRLEEYLTVHQEVMDEFVAAMNYVMKKGLDSGDKLIQKEFVLEVGQICDLCEHVKDKLVITSIKRSI